MSPGVMSLLVAAYGVFGFVQSIHDRSVSYALLCLGFFCFAAMMPFVDEGKSKND